MPRPTICPYTFTSVAKLAQPSLEHIIPDALGGPDSFGLTADRFKNAELGSSVDSGLINDEAVKVLAMTHSVKSRSGDVELKLKGTLDFNGEELPQSLRLSKNGIDLKMSKPVITDPSTGAVTGVIGWGGEALRNLEAVKKSVARKGGTVEVGEAQTSPPGLVKSGVGHDKFSVTIGMTKIAYLALAYTFGDEFISGDEGAKFRAGYAATDSTMFDASGVRGRHISAFPFMPTIPKGHHTVIAIRQSGQYLAVVKLFSSDLLTKTFTVTSANSWDEMEGSIYTCSPTGGGIDETPVMDFIIQLSQSSPLPSFPPF